MVGFGGASFRESIDAILANLLVHKQLLVLSPTVYWLMNAYCIVIVIYWLLTGTKWHHLFRIDAWKAPGVRGSFTMLKVNASGDGRRTVSSAPPLPLPLVWLAHSTFERSRVSPIQFISYITLVKPTLKNSSLIDIFFHQGRP